jgi:hypothetical protein
MILAHYQNGGKFSDEQMQEFAEMGDSAPEDYPKIKKGLFGKKTVNSQEVEEEFKLVKEKIAQFEKQASEDADPAEQEASFTGIVFIIFKNPQDCLRVTASNSVFPFTKFVMRTFFNCCLPRNWKYVFERAPEPSDIYWENMGVSTLTRICKSLGSFILTAFLMGACVGFIFSIK